jgi:hypothetical protein
MLQFEYQGIIRRMSFQKIGSAPSRLGISPMSSIMVLVYSIMRDGISLSVEDSTMVNNLDRANRDQRTYYSRIRLYYFLRRQLLFYLRNQ